MNFLNFLGASTVPDWVANSFPTIRLILIILLVVVSLVMIVLVILQPSDSEGMGALSGQSSDTYYAKNKKHSKEEVFKRATIVLGIAVAILSIAFFVTLAIYAG